VARRSGNPASILVLGIMSMMAFGGILVWANKTRPILKLRPALLKKFGDTEWKTRFFPVQGFSPSFIQVPCPRALVDREKRLEIGVFALPEYIRLAEGQTRVQRVEVSVTGRRDLPPVSVSRKLVESVAVASRSAGTVTKALKSLGLRKVRLTVLGHSFTGAKVRVTARARAADDAAVLCEKTVQILSRYPFVGRCEVELHAPGKTSVFRVGGRDVSAPKKKAPTPPKKAKPVPVPKTPSPGGD
jgi:hypothetical protein